MLRAVCTFLLLALAAGFTGLADARVQDTGLQQRMHVPAGVRFAQSDPPAASTPQPDTIQPVPAPARPDEPLQRFSLPSPVQVQIVPSTKTDAQLDAEQREHDERMALNDRLQAYGASLVAVGALLVLAFAGQALYFAAGLRGMRRLVQSVDQNATAAQRAFIYLADLSWRSEGANVRIMPTWANSGTTPTKSMRVATNWKASAGELAADFAYVYTRAPEPLFLGPHGKAEIGGINIPMRDVEAAIDERVFLYIWGRAAYEDIFEGSKPHFIEFCHRVMVSGTSGNLTLAFVQHGLRNATDQDRPIHEPLS